MFASGPCSDPLRAHAPADKHAPDSPDAVTEMNEVDSDGGTCADPDADGKWRLNPLVPFL